MSAPSPVALSAASALHPRSVVFSRTHHAVLANPPYIVPPTAALRDAYRLRYVSAHMRYGLGVPFTERLFEITRPGGFIAQITSNAFMKREHGRKLVTDVLPRRDLRLVIDTSGAFIPGHGTPTCILVARNRPPSSATVRVVQSRRGEPETPRDHVGRVWSSILQGLGMPTASPPPGARGPNSEGSAFAAALTPLCKALAKDLARERSARGDGDSIVTDRDATLAAAWITTASAARSFEQRAPLYSRSGHHAFDPHEHLARSFERIAGALPDSGYFDPDAGENPCFEHIISDAWSDRIRAEVARVVRPASTCTDWIGDVYQGLDGVAVKAHAFCQTPWFVRDLLLDLGVEPALHRFGPRATVCDPACGTGHLLVGAFWRLFRQHADPPRSGPKHTFPMCARLALGQLYGADLNPVAASLTRWRLMLAWLDASQPRHFGSVPDDLPVQVEACDALLTERPAGHRLWPDVERAVAQDAAPAGAAQPVPPAAPERSDEWTEARTAARGQLSLWGDP